MTDIDTLLQEAANEFNMDIYEVHRLVRIFVIFEIDPLKKHGGIYVFGQKVKINGFGFLHSVPPKDAICDLPYAWKLAEENGDTARLFLRELQAKKKLDAEDVRLWLEVLSNQYGWASFWSLRHPTQKGRDGFKLEAEVYQKLSGRVEERARLEFRQ
jgi:hypothetical protein